MDRKKKESLPNILLYSTIIKNRWKTLDKLGQGAFGEIYAAIDLHNATEVAVKVERTDSKKMVLKLEVIALKKLQKSNRVVRYVHSGRQDHFNYLVMERLGENLATLLKRTKRGCFSICSVVKIAIQIIDSLESIHNLGYIHRDVKPSNFCLYHSPDKTNQICLIDFNLARKYILSTGAIRPPRKHAGFRGTARYASVASHHLKELSRRDDLWSVFYIIVEFATGQLPWKRLKDKKNIGELKERFTNAELVKDLPPEFLLFMQHLKSLSFEDKPDYNYLRSILSRISIREGFPPENPFEWEFRKIEGDWKKKKNSDDDEDDDDSEEEEWKKNKNNKIKNKKRSEKYRYRDRRRRRKRENDDNNTSTSTSSSGSNSDDDDDDDSENEEEDNSAEKKRKGKNNNNRSHRSLHNHPQSDSHHKNKKSKTSGRDQLGYHHKKYLTATKTGIATSSSKNTPPTNSNNNVQSQSPRANRKEHKYMEKYLSPSGSNQKCCVIL